MKNGTMTHFSLCSGIGGLDLAAEWAGFETVGQCEIDEYASRVLAKNFKGVKNYGDIRTITAEGLARDGIREITVISAGIPCQPYSLAGKGLGDRDSRDLEQELVRVVGEVRPKWLVVENTPGLFARKNQQYFERIVGDISALGYGVAWGLWGACDVGAPQQRERVFIICRSLRNPDSVGRQKGIVFEHIVDNFNSLAPCGANLGALMRVNRALDISTHSPRVGRTLGCCTEKRRTDHFNSLAPCGANHKTCARRR